MKPRPYQIEATAAVRNAWYDGHKRVLIVLPTGTGKTVIFSMVIRDEVRENSRCLILAHREELLNQAQAKLAAATGLACAKEKADSTCKGQFFRVVVGSVQTLMREKRLKTFDPDFFDVIIVDEAHHLLADSYQRILNYFEGAKVLGVTATPDRGDMRELGEFFSHLAFEYTLPQAIREGYLCPIKALTIPIKLDLTKVATRTGDFRPEDIGTALDPYLHQIADEMVEHCKGRRTVVFLPLIATSQKFCGILREKGFRVAEVNGESQDRASILDTFERGQYDVLCNSMLLTEGWDCPPVDCIVPLRPTKIRNLYCQIVGRGTRTLPGVIDGLDTATERIAAIAASAKPHLLLLDFLWLSAKHELCRPAHLIAPDKITADAMTEGIAAAGYAVDLETAQSDAMSDVQAERERLLAERLASLKHKKKNLVDPLQFAMSIDAGDLASYVPEFGWQSEAPSAMQLKSLEAAGIYGYEIDSAGKAEKLLETVNKRREEGLTTAKQIRLLERYGFKNVGEWEFDGARKVIDRMAATGWSLPKGIDPKTYRPERKVQPDYIDANYEESAF